jgi:hypothetical protein
VVLDDLMGLRSMTTKYGGVYWMKSEENSWKERASERGVGCGRLGFRVLGFVTRL